MDTETGPKKLLCSLNLMHNILPFFGFADECFDLMMYVSSKTRKLWINKCSIFASITLNDNKFWTDFTFDKEVDNYQYNLKYSLTLECESQDSLNAMISLLEGVNFIRLTKLSILLRTDCCSHYNRLIDSIKKKGIDLENVSVALSNLIQAYGSLNYLNLLGLNYEDKLSGVKHIKALSLASTSNTEISKDDNNKTIFTQNSIKSVRLQYEYMSDVDGQSDAITQMCQIFMKLPNLTEIYADIRSYLLLFIIPILTSYWIEPKMKLMKKMDEDYKNQISIKIERTKRFQSKLNLVLKNPTFGLKLTQDNTQMHFYTAELLEIDMIEFKYFKDTQIILVYCFRDFKVKGLTKVDSNPADMVELMENALIIPCGNSAQCCITIKLNQKYNYGFINRLNSDTLLKIYENNKKNGFTIETCTSLSGITVNLLIGATNTDLDILRDTLKYFDQIHASSKFIFIEFIIKKNNFTVHITFKPKLGFDYVKRLFDILFGLRVISMKLISTFLEWKEHEYLFSLFHSKDIDSETTIQSSRQTRASVMLQHLSLQTKFDISQEIYDCCKNCKFLRTLEIKSMSCCKNPHLFKEMFLNNKKLNLNIAYKGFSAQIGRNYI